MGADASQTCHAVPVNPLNRNQEVGSPRKIEGWTAFNFPGRKNKVRSTFGPGIGVLNVGTVQLISLDSRAFFG